MKLKLKVISYSVMWLCLVVNLIFSLQFERRIRSINDSLGCIQSQKVILNMPSVDKLDTLYVDVVNKVLPCVVEISNAKGNPKGTGFVFNKKKGYILTAEHVVKVVKGKGHITKDGRKIKILDTYSDPVTDFAVVLVDVNDFDYSFYSQLELEDVDNIKVGTPVLAFGHPYHQRYSVSLGIRFAKASQNTGVSLAVNVESMQKSLEGFRKWLERKDAK